MRSFLALSEPDVSEKKKILLTQGWLWQRRDSSTKPSNGLLSQVDQVHLPLFYFFQLICTIQVERYKPVFFIMS